MSLKALKMNVIIKKIKVTMRENYNTRLYLRGGAWKYSREAGRYVAEKS
jgi:hypothetical protein